MAIPDYQTVMLPLLRYAGDGEEHSLRETIDALADEFALTPDERKALLPSGQQRVFANRVGWARTYLTKAGLLEKTRRSHSTISERGRQVTISERGRQVTISERGRQVLAANPARIDVKFLRQFEEFLEFQALKGTRSGAGVSTTEVTADQDTTPEESLEAAYGRLRDALVGEVIQQVKSAPPSLFETIVVELLLKMGYGGSRQDAGRAIGRSGDEGIDGIIKEDRLGLDIIYIQAKRWEATVGRPEVQKFAGALQGQRAKKGIMITTSSFSSEARDFVSKIDNKIVLLDGEELAEYMIDHNLGVSPMANYEVKKIDTDYFTE